MWATVLYCEHAGEFLTLYRPLWLSLCIIVVKSTCINTRFIHFLLLQVIGGICRYCKTKEQKKILKQDLSFVQTVVDMYEMQYTIL